MSSEDSSDDSEPEEPDPDEIEPIDADELLEEMLARRDEQREQTSYEWCKTIREAGERYRELKDVDAVTEGLSMPEEEVREALTVYRLIFEEPPGTAATIASRTGRAWFAVDIDTEEVVDLDDLNDPVEDLVREYVGSVYLEYNIDKEPVGDSVEQKTPEHPSALEELRETIADPVSVPTGAMTAVAAVDDLNEPIANRVKIPTGGLETVTAMDDLNETIAEKLTFPTEAMVATSGITNIQEELVAAQTGPLRTALLPLLDRQQELLQTAVSPTLTAIARQQASVAVSAVASLTGSIDDIMFPGSLLVDLAAIQPAIDAAAISTSAAKGSGGFSTVDQPSVPTPEPTPSPPDTNPVDTTEPEAPSDPSTVDTTVEPSVDALEDVSLMAVTVDATLPNPNTVSPELVYEIPALLVESMLAAGEARTWFTSLPYGHQITVVNMMLVSATFYVTRSASMAALSGFLSPAVRQLILEEDERPGLNPPREK